MHAYDSLIILGYARHAARQWTYRSNVKSARDH